MTVFDEIRRSCAAVAAVAEHVTIDHDRVETFAREVDLGTPTNDPGQERMGSDESTAAFVLALDAINFGSGYFPALRKRHGDDSIEDVQTIRLLSKVRKLRNYLPSVNMEGGMMKADWSTDAIFVA